MLALVAAVLFFLALIFALASLAVGTVLTTTTLLLAGLTCLALHVAGVGSRSRFGR
jgi:hypothetical protein